MMIGTIQPMFMVPYKHSSQENDQKFWTCITKHYQPGVHQPQSVAIRLNIKKQCILVDETNPGPNFITGCSHTCTRGIRRNFDRGEKVS